MFNISSLSKQFEAEIVANINNKTKPLGALGQLETLAVQLLNIQAQNKEQLPQNVKINKPTLAIFAGAHGIADYGVSIAASEVTGQMVANFANGGAAINVFSRQLGWCLNVVDAGILEPINDINIHRQRLGCGTKPFHLEPAMTENCVDQGFALARSYVNDLANKGCDLLAFGEMGIGNTSSASAIMSVVMDIPVMETVGKGTGVDQTTLVKKQQLIEQALVRCKAANPELKYNPKAILAELGGFEIVQICGAMLAAAERNIPIVVDGFICTAAAMIAKLIEPNVQDYFIFAHCSGEQGHEKMLQWLNAKPLLNLELRLGEGTGAALVLPLIQSALGFYNDMASFEQANVVNVVSEKPQ